VSLDGGCLALAHQGLGAIIASYLETSTMVDVLQTLMVLKGLEACFGGEFSTYWLEFFQ
jgi:hypothetical protein